LLKRFQSLEERRPRLVADADDRLKVRMDPEPVIEKSLPPVEDANVMPPVSAEPNCGVIEVTPALLLEIAQPPSGSCKQPEVMRRPV